MPYFNDSQIKKAKEIDLLTYLKAKCPDELVYESRDTYHTRTHDSLKISNGLWNWFSRGIGGKTALEYLIQVEGFTFTEAVGHLINEKGLEKKCYQKTVLTEKEKRDRLVLPEKTLDNYRVRGYLTGRGINKDIVDYCLNNNLIYQESIRNNVVFIGYDNENQPRYAGIRATNSSRFMGEAYGSDKAYSFRLDSKITKDTVHLFESSIDLLSYATLLYLKKGTWQEENLLSLAGVYKPGKDINNSKTPETLSNYLSHHNEIKKIFIHFDNDEAGRLATKAIQISLSDRYEIVDYPPKSGKDVNDFLCNYLKEHNKKSYENSR